MREREKRTFAANLRRYRLERGYTANYLSKATGGSRAIVSLYESGKAFPTIDNLLSLCEVLNVTPNDLLLEDRRKPKKSKKRKK